MNMTQFATTFIMALGLSIAMLPPTHANDRYGAKPPVIISPDLSAPWVMQLDNRRALQRRSGVIIGQQQRVITRANDGAARSGVQQAAVQAQPVKRQASTPQMNPIYLPQMVSYQTDATPGTIIIDTSSKFLYLIMEGGKARRYGVGVGKEGFEWTGSEKISRKAEWPSWRPPAQMIERERKKGRILPTYMEGGPKNPLGARALYLGSTLYRIHGTNQPWSIGQAVSSGCIRMRNQDVVDLYERVKIGATVNVI